MFPNVSGVRFLRAPLIIFAFLMRLERSMDNKKKKERMLKQVKASRAKFEKKLGRPLRLIKKQLERIRKTLNNSEDL